MMPGQASQTAQLAAMARARHQLLDGGRVFHDPLALPILGQTLAAELQAQPHRHESRWSRAFRGPVAARSRIAEDTLAEAVAAGATQYVVLGAGLDTFALRNAWPQGLTRVFEVDHPATQAWKQQLAWDANLSWPAAATLVPVDFTHDVLLDTLTAAGWRQDQPTVFAWLGVTIYLPHSTVLATLGQLATGVAAGSVVVFDYVRRPARLDLPRRVALHLIARRFAHLGEPWQGYLSDRDIQTLLPELGYTRVEVLNPAHIARTLWAGTPIPRRHQRFGGLFGGVVRAWVGQADAG